MDESVLQWHVTSCAGSKALTNQQSYKGEGISCSSSAVKSRRESRRMDD
jgi:hypothetical protein